MRAAGARQEFAYHRSIAPTLGVLLALALIETMVVHLVAVAAWGWKAAAVLGVLDLSLVVALVGLLRAIRRCPVTIERGMLTMRLGNLKTIATPVANVAGLRAQWDAAAIRRRDVANLALAAWPNVVVDLKAPVTVRRRAVVAVAHRLDEPERFAAALTERA